MIYPKSPSRAQIAKMANNDPEMIRAIELLFGATGEVTTQDVDDLTDLINGVALDAEVNFINATSYQPNTHTYDCIDLRRAPPLVDAERRLCWSDADGTMNIGMEYGVSQQVGLETYIRAKNMTGSTILNGQVVGFTGAGAEGIVAAPYLADGSTPTMNLLGVVTHDLPDGEVGYCTNFGHVRGLDTSSLTVGDVLYASPTVAGGYTATKPTSPQTVIPVAACTNVGVTDGEIFVRPIIEQQKYYGVISKTTSQSPASANTAYTLTFDIVEKSNGVDIGVPASRVTVPASGTYQLEGRVTITSGNTSKKDVYVWFRVNGVDVANSSRVVTSAVNNGYVSLAMTETLTLHPSDYLEVVYAATDTNIAIAHVPATAFSPAAPAVVLTVTQVHQ